MRHPSPVSHATGPRCWRARGWVEGSGTSRIQRAGGPMRKVFRSGALALIGLAATVAPVLTAATSSPAAGAATKAGAATAGAAEAGAATPHITPGLYHLPIVGKVTLPGSGLVARGCAPCHGRAVVELVRLRRHRRHVQLGGGQLGRAQGDAARSTSGGLSGLLGGPSTCGCLLGRTRRLQLDQRRAAGHRLGLRRLEPQLLRLVRDVPESLRYVCPTR